MTNKDLRSNFAKEMRDARVARNTQLSQVEKYPLSESVKKSAKKDIVNNFYKQMDKFKERPGYEEAMKTHLAEIQAKIKLAKSRKEKERLQKEYEEKLAAANEQINENTQNYEQAQIVHRWQVENELGNVDKDSEIIDTPADVLEFRRWFVDWIREKGDVTKEKLEKIAKIWEELVKSKAFYFKKTKYWEMWVLELWWKTMKFLNIAHPQDFNKQLTHKIKDESLKNCDYKVNENCWSDNTQDLVYKKAMPWWSKEDAWIKELLDEVKKTTWLWLLTRAEMKDTVIWELKKYCNENKQNPVEFSNENNYMLLYMYLMWPKWWYWRQWLGDLENTSRSCFMCFDNYRGLSSSVYGDGNASFFLWLLV